jgi:hypothetical protein
MEIGMSEKNIQNSLIINLSQRGWLVWRNHVGVFRSYEDPKRLIKVGIPGQSDIMAIKPVTITADMVGQTVGIAVHVEVKTPTGRQSQPQKYWQEAVEKRGGIYVIARDDNPMI